LEISGVDGSSGMAANLVAPVRRGAMILSAIVERLKRRSEVDFKGGHFETEQGVRALFELS